MTIRFVMMNDGGFVAGDMDSGMTSYAYPTSTYAVAAKKTPEKIAALMLKEENSAYRNLVSVLDYDTANWRRMTLVCGCIGSCVGHSDMAPA